MSLAVGREERSNSVAARLVNSTDFVADRSEQDTDCNHCYCWPTKKVALTASKKFLIENPHLRFT